jgi:hypothetical protein
MTVGRAMPELSGRRKQPGSQVFPYGICTNSNGGSKNCVALFQLRCMAA